MPTINGTSRLMTSCRLAPVGVALAPLQTLTFGIGDGVLIAGTASVVLPVVKSSTEDAVLVDAEAERLGGALGT